MFKLLSKYLQPYFWFTLPCIVVLVGQAIMNLYLPNLMSDMINDGMMTGNVNVILEIGAEMLVISFGIAACAIAANYFASKIAIGSGRDMRNAIFRKVESYSLREFESIGTASLITRTTNDVVQVQQVVVMAFKFIILAPITCIGGMIMALSKDVSLSVIFAVALPAMLLAMVGLASVVIPSFKLMQKRIDHLNLTLRESLTGIRVIRAFNKTEYDRTRFYDSNKDLMDIAVRVNKVMSVMHPFMMLIMNVTTIAIIWLGGIRISKAQMDIGAMMAFMQYAIQIIMSVLMVAIMFVMIPRAQASAVRINEVLDMKAEVLDPETPEKPTQTRGKVVFKNVTFRYQGSEKPVLEDISFTSSAGETTAIIGGTGSGKSTVINLIPRFYDVSEGSVLIDDVDVREMRQSTLREKIGFVPQAPILFSGTINENMRFGKKDASAEEITHALTVAQAIDFVTKMPDQYETRISQGGTNVSGGQKQRLSIARAMIRKPEIYIFDDSFSALDFKTDAALRQALKKETKDATVLIVAQRVSSIMDSDRIIVLNEGKIVGMGKHRELLNSCDVYREICSSQLSEEELK
ncbi:MAG: ABC transporter ATP-binding protein/permease [Clostridiales bacterium]|jgi:ATP-binding cassette subfamily B protein|nr:ABC transporter ATP-binding protein/permease [Clostridiales bacterium]